MRVIVVGAGLAGCSVAWHLAQRAEVVLLEAGPQPGAEASSQNAGMLRRMGEDPCERSLALRTHEILAQDERFAGVSRVCGAVLALAHDHYHLHDARSHLTARGVPVESCDRPAELAPLLAGSPLPFAWWLPEERAVDAPALVERLVAGLPPGVLRVNSPVSELLRRQDRVVGVQTADGPLYADAVVLAAGAWSGLLGGRALSPVRRSCVRSRPHALATDAHPWVWLDDVGLYARPDDGAFLLSPCDEFPEHPAPAPGSTGPLMPQAEERIAQRARTFLPALGGVEWVKAWSGLRTFAADRRPLLGADAAQPGLWWAAGLGGFGVTCCLGVGEVLATWLLGGTVDWLDAEAVRPDRLLPKAWPVRESGALNEARLRPVLAPR